MLCTRRTPFATGNLTRFYVKINTRKSLTHTRARGRKNNMKIMFVRSCTTHALHIVYLHIHLEYNKYVCAHFFIFSVGRFSTLYRCSPQLQLLYENIPIRVYVIYFIILLYLFLPGFLVLFGSDIARGRTLFCRSAVWHHNNNIIRSNVVYSA